MGLFKGKPKVVETPQERAERVRQTEERVRVALRALAVKSNASNVKQAVRGGVPADGAIYVLLSLVSMKNHCLVIREEQVEYFRWSSFGSFNKLSDQHTVVPIAQITDLRVTEKGTSFSELTISATTAGLSIQGPAHQITYAAEIIEGLRSAAHDEPGPQPDQRSSQEAQSTGPELGPKETLTQLKELRDEGLLTDDEYTAKRSEIIGRL